MNKTSNGYNIIKRVIDQTNNKMATKYRIQVIKQSSKLNKVHPSESKFNTSIKSWGKDENLKSLVFKLNIQDHTSPKQHYQNDKALIVVDCNDADIDKVIAQEWH